VNDSTWTWIADSNTVNQRGAYSEKAIATTNNYPGARYGALAFYDSCAHAFMLFGGYGFDEYFLGAYFYNPSPFLAY